VPGLLAPARTPRALIDVLNAEVHKAMRLPETAEAMNTIGMGVALSTPEEFGKLIETEMLRWGQAYAGVEVKSGVVFAAYPLIACLDLNRRLILRIGQRYSWHNEISNRSLGETMNTRFGKLVALGRKLILSSALVLLAHAALPAWAQDDGPTQEVFTPKGDKGPVVVVISGQSGPANYRRYARDVAGLGYYTVLIDGKDILTRTQDGAQNLRKVITKAQASPNGASGKVMVIGFSQGGGGVLAHAVSMSDLITAAVVHYPATSWSRNLAGVVSKIQLPILVLAAEQDRYNNCCLIEHMREMEAAAKSRNLPLELVVYPNADHGFNLSGRGYRADDAADAWRRAADMLAKHHPVR
jgi:dienelactone hydrolase